MKTTMPKPRPIPMSQRLAYTIAEAAQLIGVDGSTLWSYVRTGELQPFRLGGNLRITGEALRAFIKLKAVQL